MASDNDSDDGAETKRSRRKADFADNFVFQVDDEDTGNSAGWDFENVLTFIKRKDDLASFSTLNQKIFEKRKEKSRPVENEGIDDENDHGANSSNVSFPDDGTDDEADETDENEKDQESENEEKDAFFEKPPVQDLTKSFRDINLSRPLLKAISTLGFEHPTPIQSSTIPIALLGKDICACAATGTGKTAAFMLPILERLIYRPKRIPVTRVLVLVPTRELAIQVFSVGKSLSQYTDIEFCLAAGGLDIASQEAALRRNPDIVIATPGRLVDHLHNTPSFDLQGIEILVLDEADRMLDEHFKDQMDELIRLSPKGRQTMLFSATMTDEVEELATLSLNKPIRLFINRNTDVANNLRQEFIRIRPAREDDREAIIAALCCRQFNERCLIFMPMKWQVHRLRIVLGLLGLSVDELHGNLTQLQRLEAFNRFKKGEIGILVATDLAARGLDIEGVRTVINYNIPATTKQYVHRVGRTARAGQFGRSITLVVEKERKLLKTIVKNSKTAVKSRIISPEIITKYKRKIQKIQADIKDILKAEEEEKAFRVSEMEVNKAKNLIIHEEEIHSRPKRTFIQAEKRDEPKKKKKKNPQMKNMSSDEVKLQQSMYYDIRNMKRNKKGKRLRTVIEDNEKPAQTHKKKTTKALKTFDKELTNTSKKALKEFRKGAVMDTKKRSNGKFKSKKRYKRR